MKLDNKTCRMGKAHKAKICDTCSEVVSDERTPARGGAKKDVRSQFVYHYLNSSRR